MDISIELDNGLLLANFPEAVIILHWNELSIKFLRFGNSLLSHIDVLIHTKIFLHEINWFDWAFNEFFSALELVIESLFSEIEALIGVIDLAILDMVG